MLLLSRRPGEEVLVGPDIRVTVLEVCGNRIKLGFSGPRNVPIRRAELTLSPERAAQQIAVQTFELTVAAS